MKALGWITAYVGVIVLGPIWSGYILSVLWAWFVVPVFHLPPLSIPFAIGIGSVIRLLTYQVPDEKDGKKDADPAKALLRAMGWAFIYPLVVLVFGFIVHLFA